MATNAVTNSVRVVVQPDQMSAELIIPAGFDRTVLTPELCHGMVRQAGVELTDAVQTAIDQLLETLPESEQEVRQVIARGTPPQHGEDGHVVWHVDAKADGDAAPGADAAAGHDDHKAISYYEQSAYIMVRPGQVVGHVYDETAGEDARDVTGKTLAARAGKPMRLKLDESLMRDAEGKLLAQEEGVLHRSAEHAGIQKIIEVPEYVDFSTGNIDFNGDVLIQRGVRDRFVVRAEGNVEVKGLIEAATIECGNDLMARGGFAGRERGFARVGGNLFAKYLDNIQGEVRGDLCVDREVINCDLVIHGAITSPHGSIIGGRVIVTGAVHIATLGSGAGVPTELVLGSVPRLEPHAQRLRQILDQIREKHDAMLAEQKQLSQLSSNRPTAAAKERQTELMFELQQLTRQLTRGQQTLDKLNQSIEAQRTVDLTVDRKLCSGVLLTAGEQSFRLHSELKGPLRIGRDGSGALVYQRSDNQNNLLAQIADVVMSNDMD